jgi:tripartite-type tricarboxylate transporter receptor subunit TctC
MEMLKLFMAAALGLAALAGVEPQASAQSAYPNKPIRLIVPFSPGGITDAGARVIAEQLSRRLGQQIIVDNRAGASGNIGCQQAALAEADGYTLLLVPDSNMLLSPHVYKSLPYDPIKDFVPIGKVGDTALVVVANPAGPIKTLGDVIAAAKAQSSGLSYGTSGIGSNSHIVGELFKQRAGINLVHIPYKGGGPAMSDLMGGQIPLVVTAVAGAVPHIKSGKLLALAVPTPRRSASLPEVPTFIESGLPEFVYESWLALFAPAKTPKAIVERLNADLNTVVMTPEVRDRLGGMGIVATTSASDTFAEEIKRDLARFGPIIRNAGIIAE